MPDGLDFFGARYTMSAQGRFSSVDPDISLGLHLSDPQGWNGYAYGRNNPLKYTDPTGENYTVCGVDGKDCSDLTDDQYKEFLSQGVKNISGNKLTLIGQDGSRTAIGSADYYNEKDVEAAANIAGATGPVVNGLGWATVAFVGGAMVVEAAPVVISAARNALPRLASAAQNPELKDIVARLYQTTDKIPGGTAGAIRDEVATGQYINQAGHFIKAAERITQLERLVNSGALSGSDLMIAGHILNDLKNALGR